MRLLLWVVLGLVGCSGGDKGDTAGPTSGSPGGTPGGATGPGTGSGPGTGGSTGTGTGAATGTGTGATTGTGTGTGNPTGACTALAFANNQRVTVPRFAGQDLTGTDFTIETWVLVDPANAAFSYVPLLYSDPQDDLSGWRFTVAGGVGNRTLRFQLGSGVPGLPTLESTPGSVPESVWTHVAVTYAQTTGSASLFINGSPVSSGVLAEPLSSGNSTGDLTLGGTAAGGPYHLIGGMDDVRISSTVRYLVPFTPVLNHASDGDTLALWPFDEGTGGTTADVAAAHDGSVDGATWSSASPCDLP